MECPRRFDYQSTPSMSDDDDNEATTTTDAPARQPPDRFKILVGVGLFVAIVAGFVAWRRARDPSRVWAHRVTERHAQDIERPLRRCFGVTTGAELRRLADGLQSGPLPSPLNQCFRGPMAELLIAPNSFVEVLRDAPLQVYRLRDHERSALQRLTASFRLLERAVSAGGANPTPEQRQAIARRIEEAAPEVDAERRTADDMITAARDSAGWF